MAMPEFFNADTFKAFGIAIGGLATGLGAVKVWNRKNKVDDASAALDVTSLTAGGNMIQSLQADIARLRQTMADSDAKWRADMDKMEARLEVMGKQVDASIEARRAAEEVAARLRFQLQGLGVQPVA
jgi:hypothetical protein